MSCQYRPCSHHWVPSLCSHCIRIYPMPFARAFVDKLERLKQSAQGMPQLPEVVPSALECLQNWGPDHGHSDVWQYADFASVFNYLRGSRKLKIPKEWRGTVPDHLESANSSAMT